MSSHVTMFGHSLDTITAKREPATATRVVLGTFPMWLHREFRALACKERVKQGDIIQRLMWSTCGTKWLDHWGTTIHPQWGKVFVSEPYGFDSSSAKRFDEFCSIVNARWQLSARSFHNPGNCIRVIVYRIGEEAYV
jgi:hypothetical protein